MKHNALIRMILWSLTIVLMVGVLVFFLLISGLDRRQQQKPAETMVAVPITEPLIDEAHSAAEISPTVVDENNYEVGDKQEFEANAVSELEIEWVAGKILIEPADVEKITVKEDGNFDRKYAMDLRQTGRELKIQFCEEQIGTYFGIHTRSDVEKDLMILVPRDWTCDSLEIDCASASVEVNDLTIREVDFDGASGVCEFENCTVTEMDIDTASGDIRVIGSLDMLDCDAASASIYAVLSNTPRRLDMDTMSGDLDITLPEDAGFTLAIDAMSEDFSSEFETTLKNGNYVCGDGRCRINIDALSGDVMIRKAVPAL